MNLRRYFLITDPNYENPNPGDILIGKGIEYLIQLAEAKMSNVPIFNYVNIFDTNDQVWDRIYKEADYLIVCGTPQLGINGAPERFNQEFYNRLRKAKKKGIIVANLWVGICYQDPNCSEINTVKLLVSRQKKFITKNFSVYDLVISRDRITYEVLKQSGIDNTQLIDSVYFSPLYYNISNRNKSINLIVVRNLPNHNDLLITEFSRLSSKLDLSKSTLYLAHDITDFCTYYNKVPKLICVNNPQSLLKLYSCANQVVSLRIHGTVPASYYGAQVMNIGMDSRSNILKYVNIPSTSVDDFVWNSKLKFTQVDVKPIMEKDKDIFLDLYYNNCQVKLGYKSLRKVSKYVGINYWINKRISNYSSPIVKASISRTLTDFFSKMNFKKGLELGCAGGYFTYLMNEKGKDFYGVDLSEYVIREGKSYFKKIEKKLLVSSVHSLLALEDNEFDFVYSQQVLEHLPTELVGLMTKELYRICKKDAVLALFLVIGYKDQIAKADNDVDKTHWNLKTKEWWDNQFIEAGFTPIDTIKVENMDLLDIPDLKNIHSLLYVKK